MLDDRQITTGLEGLAATVEPDDMLWEGIRKELRQDCPQKTYYRVSAAAIAGLVVVGVVAAGTPVVARYAKKAHQPTPMGIAAAYAVGERPKRETAAAPEVQTLTLAQARQKAGFNLAMPSHLPQGYTLALVQMLNDTRNARVVFHYEIGEESLTLQQWKTHPTREPYGPGDTSDPIRVNSDEGWLWEYERDGNLVRVVMWRHDGISYIIHSSLTREEVIKVAESVTTSS